MQNNRFSFEINPAMSSQNKSINPFKPDQDQALGHNRMGYRNDTQPDEGADNVRSQNATQILAISGPSPGNFDESSAND